MLRTVLHLRATTRSLVPVCCMETGREKTREVIARVEHIIRPTPKPLPELRGMESEAWEPDVFTDEKGNQVSPLGHSRGLITTLQQPVDIEPQELRYRLRMNKMRALRIDQEYQERGLFPLGADLLAARFLVERGVRIKFVRESSWFSKEDKIVLQAYTKEDRPQIEAIDASGCSLVFEGFDYLRGLKHIRYLNLSNSHRLDDHCLFKLAYHLPTLENLDLSDCPNISERGLATLHSLTNLKRLVVRNVSGVTQKQLVCLLLEESNPSLLIEGVTYSLESIDQEIEEDVKKYEDRYALRESPDYVDAYLTENIPKIRYMEKVLQYLPKSSENGFLSKYIGVKGEDERYSRVRDEF